MKKVLSLLVVALLSFAAFSQTWIRPTDAINHSGDSVNLIGFVNSAQYLPNTKEASTLLTIEINNSAQPLTIVVPESKCQNFAKLLETVYLHEYVQVRGKVQKVNGKAQIVLYNDKQITIVRESAPEGE